MHCIFFLYIFQPSSSKQQRESSAYRVYFLRLLSEFIPILHIWCWQVFRPISHILTEINYYEIQFEGKGRVKSAYEPSGPSVPELIPISVA